MHRIQTTFWSGSLEKLVKPDPATLTMRTSSTMGQRELEKRGKNKSKNGQKMKLEKCNKQPGQKECSCGKVTELQIFFRWEVKQ